MDQLTSPADPEADCPTVRFSGRFLFLTENPEPLQRQLAGDNLTLAEAGPLRSDVSTDEITPTWITYHYDEKLGEFPYLALKCGNATPVVAGSVKAGGFGITVAGRRYGKGSSREASPFAKWCAGIRLVIAESFERIYRQNCRNLGLLTSTDFGLIDRIQRGEAIPLEEFTQGEDPLTAELIRQGGLFKLMRARQAGWQLPAPAPTPTAQLRAMTLAEKIIAQASGLPSVQPGQAVFVRTDWRYAHEYNSPLAIRALEREMGADLQLHDPASVVCFTDHLTFIHRAMPEERRKAGMLPLAQALGQVQQRFCEQHGLTLHGFLADREGSEGISHSIMTERYVLPGQLAVGTDSHTPHVGTLGALAFGIGSTEMACAWMSGDVRVQVPPTCRVRLNGALPPGVEAKDVVLHLLSLPYVRDGKALGQVFEYQGPVIDAMGIDERATLTNMVAEMGGFTGIVAPDATTRAFLQERRGVDVPVPPHLCSDADATYAHTLEVDCSTLGPMLARPGDPGKGVAVADLPEPVRVDMAYAGSCTGGKREDLQRVHDVLAWGHAHGLKLAPHTRFYVQFGSQDVRDHCIRTGQFELFQRMGAELIEPGCGACVNAGPGVSERADQVTVSAINRNFPGRSGPGQVWLASPSTVAASALAGHLTSFEQLRALHPLAHT